MKTDKTIPAETFSELFEIVLNGDKEGSRGAARGVRKLLYSSRDGGKYNDIKMIIENAPDEYRKIKEEWREENFVVAVSVLYFLHDKESAPDFLFRLARSAWTSTLVHSVRAKTKYRSNTSISMVVPPASTSERQYPAVGGEDDGERTRTAYGLYPLP